jgi:hypothetical protein
LAAELDELPEPDRLLSLMDAIGRAKGREDGELEARVHALWAR